MPNSEGFPALSTSPQNKPTFKEKLRKVRRELAKSLRMDRLTEPQMDITPSPFRRDDDYYPADGDNFFSNSPPYRPSTPAFEDEMELTDPQLDGPVSIFSRRGRASGPPVAAVFVHAGAGYHSTTNEQYHLGACNE